MGKVVDFYEKLMGSAVTVEQVVSALSAEFGHIDMDYLAGDAECIYHADLTCEGTNLDLSPPYFEYVRPGTASYGRHSTGQIGDLYIIVDRKNNIFYPTIAGTNVTLGKAYQRNPSDDEPAKAALVEECLLIEEEEED